MDCLYLIVNCLLCVSFRCQTSEDVRGPMIGMQMANGHRSTDRTGKTQSPVPVVCHTARLSSLCALALHTAPDNTRAICAKMGQFQANVAKFLQKSLNVMLRLFLTFFSKIYPVSKCCEIFAKISQILLLFLTFFSKLHPPGTVWVQKVASKPPPPMVWS